VTKLKLALALAAALSPATAPAQTTPTPPPQSPAQQEGAPSAPGLVNTAPQGAAPAAAAAAAAQTVTAPAGPANICRELLAFVEGQAKAAAAPPPATGAAPAAPAAPPKPLPVTLEQAQGLAGANDIPGCRETAGRLRRAGVALPAGLIALAALKVELLQTAQP
jgi:hypothetical protein